MPWLWPTRLCRRRPHCGHVVSITGLGCWLPRAAAALHQQQRVLPELLLLHTLNPDEVTVDIERAGEAEMDEMWSFVGNKHNPRWLWHAIDHITGVVLAYVFGRRKDRVFLKLKALLEPFGLTHYDTDRWGAYTRHLQTSPKDPLHHLRFAHFQSGS